MRPYYLIVVVFLLMIEPAVYADQKDFSTGPLITNYGPVALVEAAEALPQGVEFKVAFDVTKRAKEGAINRNFESAARFLNMHAAAGARPENMHIAVVIHGPAVLDVTESGFNGAGNNNIDLIKVLQNHGVEFYVCGQSAAYQGVKAEELLPGVHLSISAMTAHALLQQKGYTLNPF
jgi:intracellular sulfur oxidation DsrE/DsrF family protein